MLNHDILLIIVRRFDQIKSMQKVMTVLNLNDIPFTVAYEGGLARFYVPEVDYEISKEEVDESLRGYEVY